MAGDADPQAIGDIGTQRAIEQPQVIGVRFRLRGVRRADPPVRVGGDGLHRQVRALDQAYLHRGAAACGAGAGEVDEPIQRRHRIRQIRLQHDARLQAQELVLGQDALEDLQRQIEVVVLLHVQVDERGSRPRRPPRGVDGDAVQRTERADEPVDAAIEIPRIELRDDARRLHRHVVDHRVAQQRHRVPQAAFGLLRAEDGLAEQVQIQATAAGAGIGEQLVQRLAVGIEDQVPDQLPHAAAGDRHDQPRRLRGEQAAELHRRAVERG